MPARRSGEHRGDDVAVEAQHPVQPVDQIPGVGPGGTEHDPIGVEQVGEKALRPGGPLVRTGQYPHGGARAHRQGRPPPVTGRRLPRPGAAGPDQGAGAVAERRPPHRVGQGRPAGLIGRVETAPGAVVDRCQGFGPEPEGQEHLGVPRPRFLIEQAAGRGHRRRRARRPGQPSGLEQFADRTPPGGGGEGGGISHPLGQEPGGG
jgi:hypothetical protein